MNNTVSIIGGDGYIGKTLIEKLLIHTHYDLHSFDMNEFSVKKSGVKYHKGNIFNSDELRAAISEDAVVIYLAGKHYTTYHKNRNILINALSNCIRVCLESKIRRFIYISNGSVYCSDKSLNNECSPVYSVIGDTYSSLMVEAEYLVQAGFESADIDYKILRLGEVYGPELRHATSSNIVILGDGSNYSSKIHIWDLTEILIKCIESRTDSNVFNVCDSLPITQREFYEHIADLENDFKYSFLDDKKIISDLKWSIHGLKTLSIKMDNKKIKDELSYVFKYPTYKEGLESIYLRSYE